MDLSGRPELLLEDDELRELLGAQDFSEIRKEATATCVPPPGRIPPIIVEDNTILMKNFTCEMLLANGKLCGQSFQNEKALRFHISSSIVHKCYRTIGSGSVCPGQHLPMVQKHLQKP